METNHFLVPQIIPTQVCLYIYLLFNFFEFESYIYNRIMKNLFNMVCWKFILMNR